LPDSSRLPGRPDHLGRWQRLPSGHHTVHATPAHGNTRAARGPRVDGTRCSLYGKSLPLLGAVAVNSQRNVDIPSSSGPGCENWNQTHFGPGGRRRLVSRRSDIWPGGGGGGHGDAGVRCQGSAGCRGCRRAISAQVPSSPRVDHLHGAVILAEGCL
jgi:hypothetical protein